MNAYLRALHRLSWDVARYLRAGVLPDELVSELALTHVDFLLQGERCPS